MRKRNVTPEYKTLKFGPVQNGKAIIKVEAEYEINLTQWTNDNDNLSLDDKDISVQNKIFSLISESLFDDSWGRITAERVALKHAEIPKELSDKFTEYRKKYMELKAAYENAAQQKEISNLEERLKQLKGA